MRPIAAALLVLCLGRPEGYPSQLSRCRAWLPGETGYMMATMLQDGSLGGCELDLSGVPAYVVPGVTYSVVVKSAEPALFKLYSSDGQCLGRAYSLEFALTSQSFAWLAPDSPTITLHALCGTDYMTIFAAMPYRLGPSPSEPLTKAPAVTATPTAVAVAEPSTEPTPKLTRSSAAATTTAAPTGGEFIATSTSASTATTTTSAATAAKDHRDTGIEVRLANGLAMDFQRAGEHDVLIRVRLARQAWVGLGVAASAAVSMDGDGGGTDVVVCSEGQVRRYLVTGRGMPQESVEVPGSECVQASGRTVMTFSRSLLAQTADQRSVTPGTAQGVIFAYGEDQEVKLDYHGSRRQGMVLDFGNGDASLRQPTLGPLLDIHAILMTLAWGLCLPFGASVANRLRAVPGTLAGAWFEVHWKIQCVGWLLQLLGFGTAFLYVSTNSVHFQGVHTWVGAAVTAVATLQPFIAVFRPHAVQPKTFARLLFEVVHKGGGWLALVAGFLNLWLGMALLQNRDYSLEEGGILLAGVFFCITVVVWFFALSTASPSNRFSHWLLGSKGGHQSEGSEDGESSEDTYR